ncbi:MAG TPA: hypothetical protein VMV69_16880 [Pirellulales bacterium]|nr:hypothetical protein [Pirellulales bacterium]
MKRIALVAALLCTVWVGSATSASARYYRRPVARAAARAVLSPYRGYYGPRYYGGGGYYGGGYYRPRYYGYGPRWGYGPGAYLGIGVY